MKSKRTVSYPDSALPLARARTQKILNLPNCLYTKRSCRFLQSYEKTRAEQNKLVCFLCRVHCNFAIIRKVTEKREQYKINRIYFFCRVHCKFAIIRKVTKKRMKCKRKTCFSSHFRVPRTSAKPELRKKETIEARQQFFDERSGKPITS